MSDYIAPVDHWLPYLPAYIAIVSRSLYNVIYAPTDHRRISSLKELLCLPSPHSMVVCLGFCQHPTRLWTLFGTVVVRPTTQQQRHHAAASLCRNILKREIMGCEFFWPLDDLSSHESGKSLLASFVTAVRRTHLHLIFYLIINTIFKLYFRFSDTSESVKAIFR